MIFFSNYFVWINLAGYLGIELTILHLYKIITFQQLSTFFQTLSELGNGWEWGHESNPSHYIFVFLNIIEINSSFKTLTDVWNEYVLEGSVLLNIFNYLQTLFSDLSWTTFLGFNIKNNNIKEHLK